MSDPAGGLDAPAGSPQPRLDLASARLWAQKWRWYERNALPWNRARIHLEFARRRSFARWPLHGNVLESLLDGRLELGADVLLEPNVWITMPAPARIRIGRGTFLNLGVMVAALELVEIGAHCMFANGCLVTDANHRFDDPDRPITWQGFTTKGPTRIGDNVWCGANVIVTSGVTIGERCVIGANSVVTGDIPPFSVAAGSPAQVLRTITYEAPAADRAAAAPRSERSPRLRAPAPSDLEDVHAVLAARDRADLGVDDFKLEDLRDEWHTEDFDLAHDARIAQDETGAVVGWAETRRQGGFAAVAPEAEGHGHGSALLHWLEARERETGREIHRQLIAGTNRTGESLLRNAGYELVRSNHRLACPLDPSVPPPATEAGTPTTEAGTPATEAGAPATVRPLQIDADAAAIHALDQAAFAGQPGYESESFDAFVREHLRVHDLDPELSRVAERDGAIVGFLIARRREPEHVGHIDLLAVDPQAQGTGVGSALLQSATSAFAAAGLEVGELIVSSANPGARRLYERFGYAELQRFDIYEKRVATR